MDLFDIDIHIFTVIKFLFNLVVKFKYIYIYNNIWYNNKYDIIIIYNLWVRIIYIIFDYDSKIDSTYHSQITPSEENNSYVY